MTDSTAPPNYGSGETQIQENPNNLEVGTVDRFVIKPGGVLHDFQRKVLDCNAATPTTTMNWLKFAQIGKVSPPPKVSAEHQYWNAKVDQKRRERKERKRQCRTGK